MQYFGEFCSESCVQVLLQAIARMAQTTDFIV